MDLWWESSTTVREHSKETKSNRIITQLEPCRTQSDIGLRGGIHIESPPKHRVQAIGDLGIKVLPYFSGESESIYPISIQLQKRETQGAVKFYRVYLLCSQ